MAGSTHVSGGRGGNYTAQELGYPPPNPPPPGDLPPGGGGQAVPHVLSFAGLIQTASRSYRYAFDEAIRDNRQYALAMRRDAVLFSALRARQRPTAQLLWHIDPRDETDDAEVQAAQFVTELIEDIPRFQTLKMQSLEALWYGRYASELTWRWENHKGQTALKVVDFHPINGDKLRYKWDGTPGILVYGNFPGTWEATDWGMAHFLTPDERQQFIIHEFEPDDSDWTEPELAGAIHGVGLRGRLYWFWWLKQRVFGLLMNYLERFANGFTIYYYQAGNREAEAAATAAAQAQYAIQSLVYPRWNSENPDVNKVERLEVGTASPALLEHLATEYFDSISVKTILGQTLSSGTGATGLGSGVADLHTDTLAEIVKYDAVGLQETYQQDLVNVMYRWNCPGVRPGKFTFEVDSPNSEELMGYAAQLLDWGIVLSEEQLLKIAQFSKPKPGEAIVSKLQPMQQAGTGQIPGVPYTGAPPGMAVPQNGQAMTQMKRRVAELKRRRLPRRKMLAV